MNRAKSFLIVDDDGMPMASVDMERLETDATILVYEMAVFCDDKYELDEIAARTMERVGVEGFGYVCAAALRLMAENILNPVLEVTDELGVDLRAGLLDALDNAHATLGGE